MFAYFSHLFKFCFIFFMRVFRPTQVLFHSIFSFFHLNQITGICKSIMWKSLFFFLRSRCALSPCLYAKRHHIEQRIETRIAIREFSGDYPHFRVSSCWKVKWQNKLLLMFSASTFINFSVSHIFRHQPECFQASRAYSWTYMWNAIICRRTPLSPRTYAGRQNGVRKNLNMKIGHACYEWGESLILKSDGFLDHRVRFDETAAGWKEESYSVRTMNDFAVYTFLPGT